MREGSAWLSFGSEDRPGRRRLYMAVQAVQSGRLYGPWSTLTQPKGTYDHPSKRKVKEKLPELAPMDQTVEQEEKEVQDRLAQL